jgi:hypothetical protein
VPPELDKEKREHEDGGQEEAMVVAVLEILRHGLLGKCIFSML